MNENRTCSRMCVCGLLGLKVWGLRQVICANLLNTIVQKLRTSSRHAWSPSLEQREHGRWFGHGEFRKIHMVHNSSCQEEAWSTRQRSRAGLFWASRRNRVTDSIADLGHWQRYEKHRMELTNCATNGPSSLNHRTLSKNRCVRSRTFHNGAKTSDCVTFITTLLGQD